MNPISNDALKQLFTEARTLRTWTAQGVSDQLLRDVYELMKWGPTSANTCPARIVFVRNGPAKDKLLAALDPSNVPKVKAAPVTAIIAWDEKFYDQLPKLSPRAGAQYREYFASNKSLTDDTAFRNGSLQGGYFIIAARALGLDCGPMSGFDNAQVDRIFFEGSTWKSNFLCNIGIGDRTKLHPREPRLAFDDACRIE